MKSKILYLVVYTLRITLRLLQDFLPFGNVTLV